MSVKHVRAADVHKNGFQSFRSARARSLGTSQMMALLSAVADEILQEDPYEQRLSDGNWLIDANSGVLKARPEYDTDLILFDARLAVSGLKWRFLAAKGLEFGEIMRDFSNRLNRIAADSNAVIIDLNADPGPQQ